MAQYWELINIDKQAELRNGRASNFWEFLKFTPAEQLVRLLKKSHWMPFRISAKDIRAAKIKATKSRLICLPQEIIDQIIYHVAEARGNLDLICLTLTCAYFFRLLSTSLQDIMSNDCGPWAGDRLVFAGDAGGIGKPYELWDFLSLDFPISHVAEGKLARRNCSYFERFERHPAEIYGKLGCSVKDRLKGETASFRRFKRLAKLLTVEPHYITHGNRDPVLRNLTTKEFVRDAEIAQSEYAYSLGEVVMVQTIWTMDPKDVGRLGIEAEWRCHRFDISVMEDVAGDDWTDVSSRAVERLALAATEGFRKRNGRRVRWYNEF